jgi:hypothetical protein
MNEAWKRFEGDFNCMTDEEVEEVSAGEQEALERAEEWLEAVASWKSAGRPRRPINLQQGL